MLKLQSVTKDYKTGDTVVHALKGVDINFRKSEFVSILGPSGCGKTTMLNIIGGLDHYTDGELFIDNVSTKDYNDRDWDNYRNHRIGFIFQSYNLIPHQTIAENVELALTISGVPKAERIKRAHEALDRVGLEGLYNKKPNQLSGGQCQRVAIARALVNDPEILLADEPTGALDTVTSVQIMDLIQEIAKECLVIMVTHNPELAERYSTRIIRLLDGNVVDDTDPFDGAEPAAPTEDTSTESAPPTANAESENIDGAEQNTDAEQSDKAPNGKKKKAKKGDKKAKLSFWQAFRLSARNLLSKIKRTLLVCFAGSIGIIGVASVIAVSTGVQNYIHGMQDDMLSGNPVTISSQALDLGSFAEGMDMGMQMNAVKKSVEDGKVNVDKLLEFLVDRSANMENFMVENDITEEYVQFVKNMPKEFYAAITTDYGINLSNNLYTDYTFDDANGDPEVKQMSISAATQTYMAMLDKLEDYRQYATYLPLVSSSFMQAPDNKDFILSQYDVLSGTLPDGSQSRVAEKADEVMIVVSSETELADLMLAQFGYYTQEQFFNNVFEAVDDDNYDEELKKEQFDYDELLGKTFTWYPNDTIYTKKSGMLAMLNPFSYSPEADPSWDSGKQLKITAILRPKEDISYGCLQSGFYYTAALAEEIIANSLGSEVVKQLPLMPEGYRDAYMGSNQEYTGGDGTVIKYKTGIDYEYTFTFQGATYTEESFVGTVSSMSALLGSMGGGAGMNMPEYHILTMREIGGIDVADTIKVYPTDFDHKDNVTNYLSEWNDDKVIEVQVELEGKMRTVRTYKDEAAYNADELPELGKFEENKDATAFKVMRSKITYTDNLAIVITMINTMINIVTSALIAFTALSLVVSTVMIAIITYVSVIERVKEIGVIRSLGGRKRDVSALFNAETFIIGGISGVLGIAVTYLLSGILNLVLGTLFGVYTIAALPWYYALLMIAISIILTLISGLIPASIAAKKDPVDALRSE